MKKFQSCSAPVAFCVIAVLFITVPAHAYIDPNAAGLLSQIITPLLVAVAAGLTFFRKRIGDLFADISRRFRRGADV